MGVTLTLPNILTIARIVIVPLMVLAFFLPYKGMNVVTACMFAAAAITDWLDGYIARKYGSSSPFGAFLDPVADKLAVSTALFLIVYTHPTPLMTIVCAIIVGREIAISALREWMAEIGEAIRVKVATLGKIKTGVQMTAIVILLYKHRLVGLPMYKIGQYLLVLAAALTLWSGYSYLKNAWPALTSKKATQPSKAQST